MRFPRPTLNWLLAAIPLALALRYVTAWRNDTALFVVSAIALVPLAGWMGEATEHLAARLGEGIGGLVNASFGNAAELIIALIALHAGRLEVVKASISGSIIGNLLLVFGAAALAGGWRHESQRFNRTAARAGSTALMLAAAALVIPSVFHHAAAERPGGWIPAASQRLSLAIAVILLATYVAMLVFSLGTHRRLYLGESDRADHETGSAAPWSWQRAAATLLAATLAVAWLSEFLVDTVEAAQRSLGVSETFVGVIIVAIVGNAAEHATAIRVALHDRMDLAIGIAIGSSLQIALFVAPVLVFASYGFSRQLSFEFTTPEIAAVALAVFLSGQIAGDGETNWVEGAQLLALYAIIAGLFYFLPSVG
ncbi:MAG TPA: calcium/proton exchanger [Opitutaceae bacterium]|nr:calcium/proton exchanger [Opitutaceae bacterium]